MKRKNIITLGIILFLAAAVLIKRYLPVGSLPELKGWYDPADEITVTGRGEILHLVRKGEKWYINEAGYPGDPNLIGNLERKIRDFKMLDLISERGYYDRYGLTPADGILVEIKKEGKLLRKVMIGKESAAKGQSFILLDDHREVYLASGISGGDFLIPAKDLRDKSVFDLSGLEPDYLSINYGGREYILKRVSDRSGEGGEGNGKSAAGNSWMLNDKKLEVDGGRISSILSMLIPLKAAEFPENTDRRRLGKTICTVVAASGDRKGKVAIFSGKSNGMHYAVSTGSEYIFTLGSWQTDGFFIRNEKDLLLKNTK